MDLEVAKKIFDSLYHDVNGYQISLSARRRMSYEDKAFTYGEVLSDSFCQILSVVKPAPGEIFYDLGSGTGRAVFLAYLLYSFQKSVGVEILKELYKTAESVKSRFETSIKPTLPQEKQNQSVEFINEDFLTVDLSNADVVFANSTCFYPELMTGLERKLETLKKDTRVIVLTQYLQSPKFLLTNKDVFQMSWGKAEVHFYTKVE